MTRINIFKIFLVLSILYFLSYSIYGKRNISSYFTLKKEIEQKKEKLDRLKQDKIILENKTKLLRPESLDLDMLEEQVKKNLGANYDGEKIIKQTKDNE